MISICHKDYSLSNEETESFSIGQTNHSISKAFQYQSNDGFAYEFHGSLSNIKMHLTKLQQFKWIDEKTRIVIIQMTLYNPNVQLFTSITFRMEILSSRAIISNAHFEPIDLEIFSSLLQMISMIIYIIYILYLMFIEFELIIKFKLKYWSMIQLGIIGCSWASVAIYVWRFKQSNRIRELLAQTNNKNVHVNLELTIYFNNILTNLLGFCCFFGLIKFIRPIYVELIIV